jgi:hypothetical protein
VCVGSQSARLKTWVFFQATVAGVTIAAAAVADVAVVEVAIMSREQ